MKLKSGKKVQVSIFVMCILLSFITACGKIEIKDSIKYENSGFAVGIDEYLYYIKYSPAQGDLYKYDMAAGKEYFVDNIFNRTNNFLGMTKIFNINNRIFYGKSVENGTLICSVDPQTSQPVSEGFINESLDAFDGENSKYDFRMYECDDNIYVLAKNKIYKLDNENTEVIFDNISSLYIYNNKCYYSLFEDNESSTYELKGSGGIWCYDFNTHDNTEIVNKEAIKNYNSIESISGDVCGVQNIIAEENKIYFLGAFDPTQISVFNEETEEIVNLTDYFRTKMFKKYKDKLYFIDRQHRLRSVSDEGNMDVIINAYVYAFSIYNDKIYYYRVTSDIGHPSELVEFDMTSQTEKIISKSSDAD